MLTFLTYAGTFIGGLLTCDLIRIAQERYRLHQVARLMVRRAEPVDVVISCWSADPANFCDRPGCPRCWGGWGRS
ncbi:hypothetical protein E1267_28190 [Nonomuraea longispora]|uniref:Uncharacterized protein n=1 Tax=Nonomuraea longispora TaxID=1848320 RepID=A0A4R4N2C1_9ACTN|nr:hypothetical protein [Nonomuraea longispora]TDC02861.1 hypothetical protein E1267_28190 [Nonomuraea longispora]